MSPKLLFGLVAIAALLAGCTSTATVRSAPAVMSYAVSQDEHPGEWGLLIDAENVPKRVESGDFVRSGWTYEVEIESGIRTSIEDTMDMAFEDIRLVNDVPRPGAMEERDLAGIIIVSVDRSEAFLPWLSGFWSATAKSDATLRIGVDIRGPNGNRLTGFSEGAQRSAQADKGGCGAGGDAIARSMSLAIEDLMEETLERLQDNSEVGNQAD